MKKLQIYLLVLLSALLAGCETGGEFRDTAFTLYSIKTINTPPGFTDKDLTLTLNGENIRNEYFPGREERAGTLKVAHPDYTPLEQANYTLKPDQIIQLLFLPGKTIELYDGENHIRFNVSLIVNSGYTAELNGQPIVAGTNYIDKGKSSGDLEIYKEGEPVPVATIPVAIEEGMDMNVMQLNETTFVEVPSDDEPDPASDKILKARFLYSGDEVLTMDEIRLDFYLLNEFSYEFMSDAGIVGSVTLQKGQLSEYIELDCSFRYPDGNAGDSEDSYAYSFHFDITDVSTGTVIADHNDYTHGIIQKALLPIVCHGITRKPHLF